MSVWMYPLHKLVFQCRLNHNYLKPSVDRFSFQPPFCIGMSCAQFLGWGQKSKFSLCLWCIKCVIQIKFMPTQKENMKGVGTKKPIMGRIQVWIIIIIYDWIHKWARWSESYILIGYPRLALVPPLKVHFLAIY